LFNHNDVFIGTQWYVENSEVSQNRFRKKHHKNINSKNSWRTFQFNTPHFVTSRIQLMKK